MKIEYVSILLFYLLFYYSIQFYKKKLVELGAMKHLKNTYSKTTNVKLTGKNHKMFKETEKTA